MIPWDVIERIVCELLLIAAAQVYTSRRQTQIHATLRGIRRDVRRFRVAVAHDVRRIDGRVDRHDAHASIDTRTRPIAAG